MGIKNYFKTFWRFYLLRKPKLILTILLTLFTYFWLMKIIDKSSTILSDGHLTNVNSIDTAINIIYFKCIKPILIYIGGMIIINKI